MSHRIYTPEFKDGAVRQVAPSLVRSDPKVGR